MIEFIKYYFHKNKIKKNIDKQTIQLIDNYLNKLSKKNIEKLEGNNLKEKRDNLYKLFHMLLTYVSKYIFIIHESDKKKLTNLSNKLIKHKIENNLFHFVMSEILTSVFYLNVEYVNGNIKEYIYNTILENKHIIKNKNNKQEYIG